MEKLKIIAHIHTDLPEKFGVPRQSGLAKSLTGRIVFEKEYRNKDALKGIDEFDYLWLLWAFEGVESDKFTATVRPPRLGGNETRGVFATRSPFRPNPIGLSSVKLEKIELNSTDGPTLIVSGIDLRDNTPIYDIKPYLPYVDSHENASNGFAEATKDVALKVDISQDLLGTIPVNKQAGLLEVLSEDPRPQYQNDPERIYGLSYAGKNVRFRVENDCITVLDIE